MTDETPSADDEVGTFSVWFLRGALVLTCLVVGFFLVQATVGFFDGDPDTDTDETDTASATADDDASDGDDVAPDDDPGTDDTTDDPAADDTADDDTTDDAPDDTTDDAPDDPAGDPADDAPGDPAAGGDDDTAGDNPTPEEIELQAFVDEAIVFIEATRERAFLERPVVEVVSVDAMTKIVLDDIESSLADDPEGSAASLAFSRAIGFFGPDDEFLDVYEVFVSGGVLGVYFPESDQLLVRSAGELSLSTKATIVHELVHAFDDQHFDLDRDDLDDDGDAGWAFAAAVEGSASWVEEEWRATLTAAEAAELRQEELAFDTGDIFSLDFGFLIYQTSVYEAGRIWLDRRIADEGVAAIDDALVNGAASSEVVVEPLGSPDLVPIDVAAPAVDGEVLWEGRGGRALIAALTFIADPTESAATGWGGDSMTVYLDADGASCLRWDLIGDTAADTGEIFDALDAWAAGVGAEVTMVGDFVRVDRCA